VLLILWKFIIEVYYKGKNIHEALIMTVEEGLLYFTGKFLKDVLR